jgi:hypothetical protein
VTVNILEDDIAYVYRSGGKIDQNVVSVMEDMGFNVNLIQEDDLPVDFSQYRFVFFNDENFRNDELIEISEIPSIVFSYYHVDDWGLTDNDGASQLGSTAPLSVLKDGELVQVYTQAFLKRRIGIPYYFLGEHDKVDSLIQVAGTKPTSSGVNLGDVIAYAEPGVVLDDGSVAQEEICFFGIIKSDFWTPAAEEMFRDCVEFVSRL